MNENRLNIVTIGAIANAVAALLAWVWNSSGLPTMGALEQGAIATIFTAAAQQVDRLSKRQTQHVLTKYGPKDDATLTGSQDTQ
jgi:hypothetical protein